MRSSAGSQLIAKTGPAALATIVDRRAALPRHLEVIDKTVVEAIWRGAESKRDGPELMVIAAPPRHGKSFLISHYLPAWFLGTFPERRVMLTTYDSEFAAQWGARARELIREHGPSLFGVRLDPGSQAAHAWNLAGHKGGMDAIGVGGALTGKGADLLIIDDPIKNHEEAFSPRIREKQWDWWLSTARTRLEPGATVILVMTRWHEDDLAGRLIANAKAGGDPVRQLCLPALAREDDPVGRKPGEALWPERYSREQIKEIRAGQSPYWFQAMYQGSPVPDEGGIFSRSDFRYFEVKDELVALNEPDGTTTTYGRDYITRFQVVDLAASEAETADYTVISEIWVTPKREMLVREVIRARVAVPDQAAFFQRHHAGGPVWFESIGYQGGIVQTMLREGFPARAIFPDRDKVTRAGVAGALYRGGRVYHLLGAPWLQQFEPELLAFPNGSHDDQVDTIAYAARVLPEIAPERGWVARGHGETITGGLLTAQL